MFKNLIISGGAFNAITFIGALQRLEEVGIINNISNIIGSSAGAVIALFIILGYKSDEIKEFIVNCCNNHACIENELNINDILECITKYGLNDGSKLEDIFSNIIFNKLNVYDLTFEELQRSCTKKLVVCGANITKGHPDFFDVDTHPTMSVSLALRISCSIPFLFTPVVYNSDHYVDAGLYANFPVSYVLRMFPETYKDDTLGLHVNVIAPKTITNFGEYLHRVLSSSIDRHNADERLKLPHLCDIKIEKSFNTTLNILDLKIDTDCIEQCIQKGYHTMSEKL